MNGKIVIKVEDVAEEATAISISTHVSNVSLEEAVDVVYSLADSLKLCERPATAGLLCLCIMRNKPMHKLTEELTHDDAIEVGSSMHESVNELLDEIGKPVKPNSEREEIEREIVKLVSKLFDE